ncbi:MAG: hypothetical protein E7616_01270 [Ruminococcaceae bacterium]|nr:hypothetical protein [Oscillospiraceae bacterium]
MAAFNQCSFIKKIILPANTESTGNYAFQNCSATVSKTYQSKTDLSWDGSTAATAFGGGSGTQASPYLIKTAGQLALLANRVNGGESFSGKYFRLEKNICLNNLTFPTIGSKGTPFAGVFDGNGLMIHSYLISDSRAYMGLFGHITGTVKDLGVQGNINLTGSTQNTYAGILTGSNSGTIENCYANGMISIGSSNTVYAGGLVGYNEGNITNCYATTELNCHANMVYAGGLSGYAKSGTIKGCYASGAVKAEGSSENYSHNGGLVAYLGSAAAIQNSYRFEGQALHQYETLGKASCTAGISASFETIKTYTSKNWSSTVWNFGGLHPKFK